MKRLILIILSVFIILSCKKVENQSVIISDSEIAHNLFGFSVTSSVHLGNGEVKIVGLILESSNSYEEIIGVWNSETKEIITNVDFNKHIFPNLTQWFDEYSNEFYATMFYVKNGTTHYGESVEVTFPRYYSMCYSNGNYYTILSENERIKLVRVVEQKQYEELGTIGGVSSNIYGDVIEKLIKNEDGFYIYNSYAENILFASYQNDSKKELTWNVWLDNIKWAVESSSGDGMAIVNDNKGYYVEGEKANVYIDNVRNICENGRTEVYFTRTISSAQELFKYNYVDQSSINLSTLNVDADFLVFCDARNSIIYGCKSCSDKNLYEFNISKGSSTLLSENFFAPYRFYNLNIFNNNNSTYLVYFDSFGLDNVEAYKIGENGVTKLAMPDNYKYIARNVIDLKDFVNINGVDYAFSNYGLIELK